MATSSIVFPNALSIGRAARLIRDSGVVAFPTETVYGLGAHALDVQAVAKIFSIKKRPFFDPLIVHVASLADAKKLWVNTPKVVDRLAKKFWPGPLTIILPKKLIVPDLVTAGLSTVGVRVPQHPVALALLKKAGVPIAAPSANLFGRTSPTTAMDVWKDLGKSVSMILDGGPCQVGLESTVIEIQNGRAILYRPGGVAVDQIRLVLPIARPAESGGRSRIIHSPGQQEKHYAPRTKMVYLTTSFQKSWKRIAGLKDPLGFLAFKKSGEQYVRRMCDAKKFFVQTLTTEANLEEAAANLFASIRKLDQKKPRLIIAEAVPKNGLGLAIADRLLKASSGRRCL